MCVLLLTLLSITSACSDDLDACLDDCGELDGFGDDAICGTDGWLYVNQCHMDCYGAEEAPDPLYCSSPALDNECDDGHVGLARRGYYECGSSAIWVCEDLGWASDDAMHCSSGSYSECIQACPACPEDDADFVCGAKGVRYCNECVMACLEDELADDPESCTTDAVFADFCDDSMETNATRVGIESSSYEDYGCNICNCENDIWHCTFWACPGNYEEM